MKKLFYNKQSMLLKSYLTVASVWQQHNCLLAGNLLAIMTQTATQFV